MRLASNYVGLLSSKADRHRGCVKTCYGTPSGSNGILLRNLVPRSGRYRSRFCNTTLLTLGVLLWTTLPAHAERLPIKFYTTADGLAHNTINKIVRDSRGFLWFCTADGLSRFDGYGFINYGIDQGLPSQVVNDLLETRDGQYWIATSAGLCRFNPKGIPGRRATNVAQESATSNAMFTVYFPGEDAKSKAVTSLLQDRAGAIWCGTVGGMYRLEEAGGKLAFRPVELGMPHEHETDSHITSMIEDQRWALWIGSESGIYRLLPDGRTERYDERHGLPYNYVLSLLEDRDGRLWASIRRGFMCRLVSDPNPTRSLVARVYGEKDGLPSSWINQLFQASDGSLWAASNGGLIQFIRTPDGRDFRFRAYAEANGLTYREMRTLAEDRYGNLWLGTAYGGAAKFARTGITVFGPSDGVAWATAIFKGRTGDLFVYGGPLDQHLVNRFDGERFTPIQLEFPPGPNPGWGGNQSILEDHAGEWWVATGNGLGRFPKVRSFAQLARTPPQIVYTTRDGLASDDIRSIFEDSRGDIWVATENGGSLSRWDRATETFHHYTERDGLPSLTSFYPTSFAEDRAGAVWVGFNFDGGLVRYRDGRFTHFTSGDGLPAGAISIPNLFVDSSDRLWVPTNRGVCRIDQTQADRPTILTYTTANGLSSNTVTAVTEDRWGHIYLGIGRGIDRLDPATGHIKRYTANEGALLGNVNAALQDKDGALWFSFNAGLVRLVPEPDLPPIPPPVLITGLRIVGDAQPVSALGETDVAAVELPANRNQLQIDFVALGFSPGAGLRYQYMLEGAAKDWSLPSDQRTVNFAHLAPGQYRFLVRAINADGVMSERAASFAFTILPPIWQRWWFVTLAAVALLLVVYAVYRYRVARLLELERVRTRIAADLHDDIGSSLSQISVLSEVLRTQLGAQEARISKNIALINRVSHEALDSMSDIVWAINPQQDHLSDLVRRMRRVASEMLPARGIEFSFNTPTTGHDLKLGADIRRQVFLMFKEAINNVVRHSGCTRAEIDLKVDGAWMDLRIADNGKGFDPAQVSDGNGLVSLRRRAASLGGESIVSSRKDEGTTITVKIPHGHHWRFDSGDGQVDGTTMRR